MRVWMGAALALAAATASAQECIPQCRDGFVCWEGTCISACNPPCGAGEVCRGAGECVPATTSPTVTPTPVVTTPVATTPVVTTTPAAVPVEDMGAERERRREARTAFRLAVYAGGGGFGVHDDQLVSGNVDASGSGSWSEDAIGGGGTVGFGARQNFSLRVGWQARLTLAVGALPDVLETEIDEFGERSPIPGSEDTSIFTRLTLDASLRFGPIAWGFPLFVGLGGEAGMRYVSRGSADAVAGVLVELGFLLGRNETIELAFRGSFGLHLDWTGVVSLGFAVF